MSEPWWLMPSSQVTGNWYVGSGKKTEDNMRVIVAGKDSADAERLAKRIVDLLNATAVLSMERNSEVRDDQGYCDVCGDWQHETPSGLVCTNGHGGADTVDAVAATHLRAVWRGKSEEERQRI